MKVRLDPDVRRAAEREIGRSEADGWLLFDLEGRNRIAAEILGLPDGLSRRYFVLLRPDAPPTALVHAIEQQPWEGWPGEIRTYVGWQELDDELSALLAGCGRVAMEVSERDAVPFVDYVPAGVRDLVESHGPEVISSAGLISGSYAQWGERGHALHHRAGRVLADVAARAYRRCLEALSSGKPVREAELAAWVREQVGRGGLGGGDCIVAFGPNSANPHYHPVEGEDREARPGETFLLDLWARVEGEPDAVFADQTWMGLLAEEPPAEFREAWEAVRDARDATVELIARRMEGGSSPRAPTPTGRPGGCSRSGATAGRSSTGPATPWTG
jgi:Xaa-Pro aminopeptidase